MSLASEEGSSQPHSPGPMATAPPASGADGFARSACSGSLSSGGRRVVGTGGAAGSLSSGGSGGTAGSGAAAGAFAPGAAGVAGGGGGVHLGRLALHHRWLRRQLSSAASATSAGSSPPPAEIEATCLRCTLRSVSGEVAEELGDMLLAMGAQSVVVQEHRPPGGPEQEIFDDGQSRLWDRCDLMAHFPLEADVEGTLLLAAEAAGLPADLSQLSFGVEPVANESWVEQIKASYVPLQLSDDLWVIPEWSQPVDPGATNIVLQPGVAFGTGEHPTTRLCLRELRRLGAGGKLAGAAVCDYGTGSGVLAIAALKYGASRAVGTDIDSLAVKAAQRNGALNGFEPPAFSVLQVGGGIDEPEPLAEAAPGGEAEGGGGGKAASFDVVVANILRGPLVELQPRLARYVRPGGLLLLSGILAEQAEEVAAAYASEFGGFEMRTDAQWALLTATKKAGP
ncbi:hypothetical protein GPECTOR_547g556 [Gonium pectorale]|uniref:ETFB lysine methyltransferase n=1 Tax=Gonium pectorale TaxID=33097 RepID=A0A150FUR3_GONPE|nr:hypothetical protein GPECTOR_547g556 [Gonium pectorale]|eukprot:KXZ41329.1 hypothetical protein GPECTOR_547g556 [Gonium pectorale]